MPCVDAIELKRYAHSVDPSLPLACMCIAYLQCCRELPRCSFVVRVVCALTCAHARLALWNDACACPGVNGPQSIGFIMF